jgi:dUTP pyrophosphatase
MMLEYYRLRSDVKPPTRANPSDAGLDLIFNPADGKEVILGVGDSVILATGYKFGIPHGYMMQIMNRSGMAAKRSLIVGAHVVDSGYDGEVFVNLHNIGNDPQTISPGDKIAQAVIIPVVAVRFLEAGEDNLYGWHPITVSNRGDGALGSTGR